MQLNLTTDYAVRVILCLGTTNIIMPSDELADMAEIPKRYLPKILSKLRKAAIVESVIGKNGGYCLLKELKDIKMWEILEVMENTMKINRCMEEDRYCSRNAAAFCPVRRYYEEIQKDMEEKYFNISLQEVAERYGGAEKEGRVS